MTFAAYGPLSSARAQEPADQDPGFQSGQHDLSPAIGGSGLPVPRFVSLASDKIYMRTGPGQRYPIRWIYERKGLPVIVEAEFDIWRRVRDVEGERGWVHGSLLSGRRTVQITGGLQELHQKAHPGSLVVLRAEEGVTGELVECDGAWCEVRISGRRGWIGRDSLWGVLPAD